MYNNLRRTKKQVPPASEKQKETSTPSEAGRSNEGYIPIYPYFPPKAVVH
jgi:hypothetical protein